MLVFAAIVPHPPVSVEQIGNEEEMGAMQKTLHGFSSLRRGLEEARPDVVIVISPHAPIDPYAFVMNSQSSLRGNLQEFGFDSVFEFKNDIGIVESLEYACQMNEMPAYAHPNFLDHGAIIPLYHLLQNIHPHVVHLSFSMLSLETHYLYGKILARVYEDSPKRIAIIASGDLSHRLSQDAPAGYFPSAKFFDQRVIEALGRNDMATLMGLRGEYIEDAAECGLRSFMILLGALHDKDHKFDLISYEAPFGVGYLVARLF